VNNSCIKERAEITIVFCQHLLELGLDNRAHEKLQAELPIIINGEVDESVSIGKIYLLLAEI